MRVVTRIGRSEAKPGGGRSGGENERGQGVTEMALVLIPFLLLLFGLLDLGRGIYAYNAVAEAARELARVTSVHAGDPLGASAETTLCSRPMS